ncbi:hypothetical protein XJ28_29885 (plasmid) [Pseudomonas syringae pv. tomato]|uniref:hypothetical protein n=1 Tax=Pseudomonas syringae group genomosp. 3 TaxID=251701 RepID=UPI000CF6D7A3|nr:hypothetical protein [Pseudomonas syringae group genomosp. 3]AVI87930.1 hypothetical protein XJ28_29885 [Pseudomonas syringae pv. tomato]MDT3237938.1 hypothetical protein [Pseudomonas syringae pv. tomato]
MELSVALIVLSLASVCLGEAGLRTGDLAYIQAGTLALVLAFFLMLAIIGLEIVAWLQEKPLSEG